jgi:hypothetical protein
MNIWAEIRKILKMNLIEGILITEFYTGASLLLFFSLDNESLLFIKQFFR